MIKWCNQLYTDEGSRKKLKKIKRALEAGKKYPDIYCILLSANHKALFDIIYCKDPAFLYYNQDIVYITGLAESRKEAKNLLTAMAEEIYAADKEFKVKEFFTFS